MTNPPDIIGIVKNLQQIAKNATEGDWRIETNSHGLKQDIMAPSGLVGEYWSEQDAEFIVAARKHFSAIAQALLIAVEALEEIEDTEERCDFCSSSECVENYSQSFAHDALSRIRSLPKA